MLDDLPERLLRDHEHCFASYRVPVAFADAWGTLCLLGFRPSRSERQVGQLIVVLLHSLFLTVAEEVVLELRNPPDPFGRCMIESMLA